MQGDGEGRPERYIGPGCAGLGVDATAVGKQPGRSPAMVGEQVT